MIMKLKKSEAKAEGVRRASKKIHMDLKEINYGDEN
jgi:hypothetical protein